MKMTEIIHCACYEFHLPTRDPAERPITPPTTIDRPYAAGNLVTLYSATISGIGTWIKLLVNPRYPLTIAIVRKSS
jgi:hypothetical protein